MEEDVRITLTLVSEIFRVLNCGTPARLINQFLKPAEDEKEYLSIEDLNEKLDEYLKEKMVQDVDSSSRMIRLGDRYIPLPYIKSWRVAEKYSYADNRQEYLIVLNETEGKSDHFSNIVCKYSNKEDREKDIEKLLEMKLTWSQL